MVVPETYLRGVTWNGANSDTEYIDARAQMSYNAFLPEKISGEAYDAESSEYMDSAIADFVTGEKDVGDDREWDDFTEDVKRALYKAL